VEWHELLFNPGSISAILQQTDNAAAEMSFSRWFRRAAEGFSGNHFLSTAIAFSLGDGGLINIPCPGTWNRSREYGLLSQGLHERGQKRRKATTTCRAGAGAARRNNIKVRLGKENV
jgi:hypothetical protein